MIQLGFKPVLVHLFIVLFNKYFIEYIYCVLGTVLGAATYPAVALMKLNYVVALFDFTDGDLSAMPNSFRGRENKKEIEGF